MRAHMFSSSLLQLNHALSWALASNHFLYIKFSSRDYLTRTHMIYFKTRTRGAHIWTDMRVLIREYNISGLQRGSCNWSAHSSSRSSKPSLLSVKCERPSSDRVRTSALFFFGSHLALIWPSYLLANVYVNYFYFHTWRKQEDQTKRDSRRSCRQPLPV